MRAIKEVLNNLKRNSTHFVLFFIMFSICNVAVVFSCIIFPVLSNQSKLYYYNFSENNILLLGAFNNDNLHFLEDNNYECFGYNISANAEIKLANNKNAIINIFETNQFMNTAYTPSYDKSDSIEKTKLIYGRGFSELDYNLQSRSLIIYESMAKILYGNAENACETILNINNKNYKIIGVLEDSFDIKRLFQNEFKDKICFYCYTITSSFQYSSVILSSPYSVTEKSLTSLENYFQDGEISAIIHTKSSVLSALESKSNNFYMIVLYSVLGALVAAFALITTLLLRSRKKEIVIKKNLGATFFDIYSEFIYEYGILMVISLVLFIGLNHFLIWMIISSIYKTYFIMYVAQNYILQCFASFFAEITILLITIVINIFAVYAKNISRVMKG